MHQRVSVGVRWVLLAAALSMAASCKSEQEEIADLLNKGAALEQIQQYDAALQSYRDALDIDGENIDVRRALAQLNVRLENLDGARAQYTAIRERLPNDVDANLSLAEINLAKWNADMAARDLAVPLRLAKDDPRTRAAAAAVAYYSADTRKDDAARQAALDAARAILEAYPDQFSARRVVIQAALGSSDPASAAAMIDAALKARPRSLEVNMMKLDMLNKARQRDAAIAQLKLMYGIFPDNKDIQGWLKDWYLSEGKPDDTVAFLLDLAARTGNDLPEHEAIADYIVRHLPPDAAAKKLTEVSTAAPSDATRDIYLARAAQVRFGMGEQASAISQLRDLLSEGRPLADAPHQRVALARMLASAGQRRDGEQIISDVLSKYPTDTGAQKLFAEWKIADKDYSSAITALRIAQTADASDPEIMTMLGESYAASGSPALAAKAFADAVTASGNGVRESIIFARFLLAGDDQRVAQAVLSEASARHPNDPDLKAFVAEAGVKLLP